MKKVTIKFIELCAYISSRVLIAGTILFMLNGVFPLQNLLSF